MPTDDACRPSATTIKDTAVGGESDHDARLREQTDPMHGPRAT